MVYSLASQDRQPGLQPFAKVAIEWEAFPYVQAFTPCLPRG
jgi:hypothetical protein